MDDLSIGYEWAKTYQFDETELLYATILALKILDGQCKMDYDNYNLFMSVYDGINERIPTPFESSIHKVINLAREDDPLKPKKEFVETIHTLRVKMMENMDKPSMKAYKQLIWNNVE
jgi:hypothetical protein